MNSIFSLLHKLGQSYGIEDSVQGSESGITVAQRIV